MTDVSPLVTLASWVAFGLILIGFAFALFRVMRGPTLADRVVALDLVTLLAVAFLGVFAIISDVGAFLDVAITLALVGFLATLAFARYAEKRAARADADENIDD
ncbi:MAG: pH regulation protein F [Alphaproteobacteria bacterium]|jgi:multicomponent Na+:H+ antiporter subunit F|nr:pH regulation protein F [Alphaproteobacteria bacterium]